MWTKGFVWILLLFDVISRINGCTIPGVNWNMPILGLQIKDIDRGEFYRVSTSDITGITSSIHSGDELINGPYIIANLDGDDLVLALHSNFETFEEYETVLAMGFSITFSCNGTPSSQLLALRLTIVDTNNNKPVFIPTNEISFSVIPPLAPGFKITGCNDHIVVRDIDLTTTAIDFGIEENEYFEIAFDADSTVPNSKNFLAVLRTKTFIRSIPNPIHLQISATDVDNTNDPPHTTYATVTIDRNPMFQLPDDLIFTETFYLASYTTDHTIEMNNFIALQQGFDDEVTFQISGDLSSHFALSGADNSLTLTVQTPLPLNILREKTRVLLTVTAERELVPSSSATIVIDLPREFSEPAILRFSATSYKGAIEENNIVLDPIVLIEGFLEDINFDISGEHENLFRLITTNAPILSLELVNPLLETVDRLIILQLRAYGPNAVTAYATIIFEIESETAVSLLVFSEVYYSGSYNQQDGLDFTDIITLTDGYNEDVVFELEGTNSQWFIATPEGNRVDLAVIPTGIPMSVIANNQHLTLTVKAERPGAITGRAAIVIALSDDPAILRFTDTSYKGTIKENNIILDSIILSEGFSNNIQFDISGEHVNVFQLITTNAPILSLELVSPLPENIDRLIILQLRAYGPNAVTAYATIILETESETDASLLVFSEVYYSGSYNQQDGLDFTDIITLTDGYSENVVFELEGIHSQWFIATPDGNRVDLTVITTGIPMSVIANNQHLTITVRAKSPGAITGRAAIIIALPDEFSEPTILRFSETNYKGTIEETYINLDTIRLLEGFSEDVNFDISGEHENLFQLITTDAPILSLEMISPLPENIDRLIILQLRAYGPNAVTAYATIILETESKTDVSILVFSEVYYSGSYNQQDGLDFTDIITLTDGYSENVVFELEGIHSQWFIATPDGNRVDLTVITTGIPMSVIANNQHLTITVRAESPGAITGRAAIIIALPDEFSEPTILRFSETSYKGTIEETNIVLDTIRLLEGFSEDVNFDISGEHENLFQLITTDAPILSLEMVSPLPENIDRLIILQLRAYGPNAVTAYATIILETESETDASLLVFSEVYYSGSYNQQDGLDFTDIITLTDGYSENVVFELEGIHSQWFIATPDGNRVDLTVITTGIPMSVIANNQHLTITVRAESPGAITGRAAIIIALPDEISEPTILRFSETSYKGTIEETNIVLDTIRLLEGFSEDVNFDINGEHENLFQLITTDAPILSLEMVSPLPENIDRLIILQLRAYGPNAVTAYATIILETESKTDVSILVFSEVYYSGSYNQQDGLDFTDIITLTDGYSENVVFELEGIHSQWFIATPDGNRVDLTVITTGIPMSVIANNQHLTITVRAESPGAITGRAAIIIALPDEFSEPTILRFSETSYKGTIEETNIVLDTIRLLEGFSEDVNFDISGEHENLFQLITTDAPILSLEMVSPLPENIDRLIILQLRAYGPNAVTAYATIILETSLEAVSSILVFNKVYYKGIYNREDGLDFTDIITLEEGYNDGVQFELEGENSQWFIPVKNGNRVDLSVVSTGIPLPVLTDNNLLTFSIRAYYPFSATGRAAIIIAITGGPSTDIYFLKALYLGSIELNVLLHETIELVGYEGDVQIIGDSSHLFKSSVANGEVHIQVAEASSIPLELNHVTLELRADVARTVLSIEIIHTDDTIEPKIEFDPSFYIFRVDVTETGFIGRVNAVSNNGETILYSLQIDNEHLLARLSISAQGELHISSPASSGQYSFLIVATTAVSGVSETAPAELIVDAVTVCGDNYVIPPLIIIERDEEEPYENLVVLEDDVASHCHFSMVNRWPPNQNWLSVDKNGLHTTAIDREDESIAFMTVSQVRVELILHCDNEEAKRSKRSIINNDSDINALSHYDYGSSRWILTDTILYNSKRSFVNLIVNDINDNNPIFEGKENEPIIIGYPVFDLIDIVMPRALAEVKATDKDIGINAQLIYWSDEQALTVDRETGIVHVRNNMLHLVSDNSEYTISVRDRPGMDSWRFGTIKLQVKLLKTENIAILTIRDAFLSDEQNVLREISEKLQYDVKSLRTTVISAQYNENNKMTNSRNKQDTEVNLDEELIGGASLLLYVYGLENSLPVTANKIVNDLENIDINTIAIIHNMVLGDYLDSRCPVPGRDTALFAATITLSIVLFLLIVFIVLWYFLKIRKTNINYEEFNDTNSISNQSNIVTEIQKVENIGRPKINIEHIKKSERRLQEMLNAPIEGNKKETVVAHNSQFVPTETIIDINTPDKNAPIVIQSIDKLKDAHDHSDEDEFGEVKTSPKTKKSVVTFNENVEKIIHVEDHADDTESVPDYEVDRL